MGKTGFSVNEGPAVLTRNGKIFITYSGSATDENYAMGLLWADEQESLLKNHGINYRSQYSFLLKNKQFGPGHNSFTVSEDGCFDILIYHARPEKNQKGSVRQS